MEHWRDTGRGSCIKEWHWFDSVGAQGKSVVRSIYLKAKKEIERPVGYLRVERHQPSQ
jgi:hypothetical protein